MVERLLKTQTVTNLNECALCEYIIGIVKHYLEKNTTEVSL